MPLNNITFRRTKTKCHGLPQHIHVTTRVTLLSRGSLSIVSDALHLIYRVYNICLISISDLVPLKLQKKSSLNTERKGISQNCAKEFLPDVWNTFCAKPSIPLNGHLLKKRYNTMASASRSKNGYELFIVILKAA